MTVVPAETWIKIDLAPDLATGSVHRVNINVSRSGSQRSQKLAKVTSLNTVRRQYVTCIDDAGDRSTVGGTTLRVRRWSRRGQIRTKINHDGPIVSPIFKMNMGLSDGRFCIRVS